MPNYRGLNRTERVTFVERKSIARCNDGSYRASGRKDDACWIPGTPGIFSVVAELDRPCGGLQGRQEKRHDKDL
jgi:hypothetical protein